ncbi:MAG: ABC transporter permease [Myxococcales bacterium]|nr:ABC transporter permease [Myxococcales bacterium]
MDARLRGDRRAAHDGLRTDALPCQQGFATTGGAEGVGKRTTASVVSILFTLIIIDAGFTILFHVFGL